MFRENLAGLRSDMERLKKGQTQTKVKSQKQMSITQGGLFTTFDVMAVTDSDDSSLCSDHLQ
jgi:hypothetical protein